MGWCNGLAGLGLGEHAGDQTRRQASKEKTGSHAYAVYA